MIIILEGPDGGGKSTLARQYEVQGFNIIKTNAPKPGEDVLRSYHESLSLAIAGGVPTAFDRHYLGECIYGPLLRGEDRLGARGKAIVEETIGDYGVKLIICLPPWDALRAGWASKSDLVTDEDTLKRIAERYREEAARLNIPVYDWTTGENPCPEFL